MTLLQMGATTDIGLGIGMVLCTMAAVVVFRAAIVTGLDGPAAWVHVGIGVGMAAVGLWALHDATEVPDDA